MAYQGTCEVCDTPYACKGAQRCFQRARETPSRETIETEGTKTAGKDLTICRREALCESVLHPISRGGR